MFTYNLVTHCEGGGEFRGPEEFRKEKRKKKKTNKSK